MIDYIFRFDIFSLVSQGALTNVKGVDNNQHQHVDREWDLHT